MSRNYDQFFQDHFKRRTGEDRGYSVSLRPFWSINRQDDRETLNWLSDTLDTLQNEQEDRAYNQVRNVRFYNGVQMLQERDTRTIDWDRRPINKTGMFVLNHARDLINQVVNRIMRYNPAVNVLPVNNEYTDRIGARVGKRVADHIFRLNDMRDVAENSVREAKLCGESYMIVDYDPFTGDLDPQYDLMQEVLAVDPNIDFQNSAGQEVLLQMVKRVGEVRFRQPLPWMVFLHPAARWKDVEYCFIGSMKHMDELRAENPGVDFSNIKPTSLPRATSGTVPKGYKYGDWVVEYEFYHIGHRFLDEGAYCRFIPGVLLKHEPLPFSHRGLPLARFTDIDDPFGLHGLSILDDLRPPLVLFNRLANLMYRNVAIGAHPKMFVPNGSCNFNSLANGMLVVEYDPPYEPKLVSFNTIGAEVFQLSEKVMSWAQQFSGVFGISRGETIPNARAGSILSFYEEQEEQREGSQIKKYNSFIERVATLSLGTAGDFYSPDDGRTIRVVGKNNQYKVYKIQDVSKLSGPYDIIAQRTTALAESKQGRIDQISTLSSAPLAGPSEAGKPGLFTREQILRMLEVADLPAFFEAATAAVDAAESENEDIYEGREVAPPEEWHQHLVHWNVHYQFIQSREFSDTQGVPPEVRQNILDHLLVHEGWMYMQAQKSLAFCNELVTNPNYPCIFSFGLNPSIAQLIMIHQQPPVPPSMAPPPPGPPPPQGAAGPAPGGGPEAPPDKTEKPGDLPPEKAPPEAPAPESQPENLI